MKIEKYQIKSHTFKGSNDFGYTYEITFNRSLNDTERMNNGIAGGLNRYIRRKQIRFIIESLVYFIPDLITGKNPVKMMTKYYPR